MDVKLLKTGIAATFKWTFYAMAALCLLWGLIDAYHTGTYWPLAQRIFGFVLLWPSGTTLLFYILEKVSP